jgi:hypothetical protein
MTKEQINKGVLEAASLIRSTEFVIIGSQAVQGLHPDIQIDSVLNSEDVDLFPTDYRESMFIVMHERLGFEYEFWEEHGYYVEIVRPELPRFPTDWRDRANSEIIGKVDVNGEKHSVTAIYPDIHDLTASKVVVGRPSDFRFLADLIRVGIIDEEKLSRAVSRTPRTSPEVQSERIKFIQHEFKRISVESRSEKISEQMTTLVNCGLSTDFDSIAQSSLVHQIAPEELWSLYKQKNPAADIPKAKARVAEKLTEIELRQPLEEMTSSERVRAEAIRSWFKSDFVGTKSQQIRESPTKHTNVDKDHEIGR